MESTFEPQVIYDVFARHNLCVSRIDNFDKGDYAQIRIDLSHPQPFLLPAQLLELSTRLKIIETAENIRLEIVHIDMRHRALRINIHILSPVDDTKIRESGPET